MGGGSNPNEPPLPFVYAAMSAGAGGCVAEMITLPLDTLKVTMQVNQGRMASPLAAGRALLESQGVTGFWRGLTPGLQRQMLYATLRMSLYDPIRDTICAGQEGPPLLWQRIAAGLLSGAFGMLVANPTDLVKIRMQSDGRRPAGTPPRYTGTLDAYKSIIRNEGFLRLWTGVGPNIVRNAVINSSEMAAYDQLKYELKRVGGFTEGLPLHSIAAVGAGFVATVIGSPVDVLKTRLMNARLGEYKGPIDCIISTLKEGPKAFYRGFTANFLRIGSFNVVIFVAYEQFKNMARRWTDPEAAMQFKDT